jgi:Zn-dependent peptidase ImmA (M78 family)
MSFSPEILSYRDIAKQAEEFLSEYHPAGSIPVPIEAIVEFDLDMAVVPIDGLQTQIRAVAFLASDLSRIFVDEWAMKNAPERHRFSLAHEVGHYWLHDSLYQECSIRSVKDWEAVQDQLSEEELKWFEFQANAFAGLVLAPPEPLRSAWNTVMTKAQAAGIKPSDVDRYPERQHIIRPLATQFEVSETTMEIRLVKDGLLTDLTPLA